VQHELGGYTLYHGWDTAFKLSAAAGTELQLLLDVLFQANGQYIFSAATLTHTYELADVVKKVLLTQHSAENREDLFVSDSSDSHAFVYRADGSFEYVREFEFDDIQRQLSSGHRELLAIKLALCSDAEFFRELGPHVVYWQTDSKNCFYFLLKGSKIPSIQRDVFEIKKLERDLNIIVMPVWTPRSHFRIMLADAGSKLSTSTDEWCLGRHFLLSIFENLDFWPTVDCFASAHNKVCDKFFAAMPQTGALGVNFFAQNLLEEEKYFCCPPVKLVVPCFKKLAATKNVCSVLLVPEWTGAVFWPYIFTGKSWRYPVVKVLYSQAGFFFSNNAESKVFTGKPNFRMVALLLQT